MTVDGASVVSDCDCEVLDAVLSVVDVVMSGVCVTIVVSVVAFAVEALIVDSLVTRVVPPSSIAPALVCVETVAFRNISVIFSQSCHDERAQRRHPLMNNFFRTQN